MWLGKANEYVSCSKNENKARFSLITCKPFSVYTDMDNWARAQVLMIPFWTESFDHIQNHECASHDLSLTKEREEKKKI